MEDTLLEPWNIFNLIQIVCKFSGKTEFKKKFQKVLEEFRVLQMLYNCIFSICILFYLHEGSLPRQARKDTNPTEVYPFDRSLTSSTDMFSHFRSLQFHWGISCSVWLLPTHSHQKTDNPSAFHLSKSSCVSKLQLGCSGLGFFFFLIWCFAHWKLPVIQIQGKKQTTQQDFLTHTRTSPQYGYSPKVYCILQ